METQLVMSETNHKNNMFSANKLCIKQITAYKISVTSVGKRSTYKSPFHFIEHHSFKHQRGVGICGVFILQPPALLPEKWRQKKRTKLKVIQSDWLKAWSRPKQRQNHSLTWSPALVNKERKLHPDRLTEDSGSPSHSGLRMDTWCSHWLFKHIKKTFQK